VHDRPLRLAVAVVLFAAGCSAAPPVARDAETPHAHLTVADGGMPPLFDDLGDYHRPVTTASGRAQAYFDQGLRLVYGFNHVEAQLAFREAVRADPDCAMGYWGIALTSGSNYNSPTDAARERLAYQAIQGARALASRASAVERALIDALAARHSARADAARATLDRGYADAMREVARRFPDDADASTLFADAMMNLRPWNLWAADGQPHPGTPEILAALEHVLAMNPYHPGANHLYIHAVEASPQPARGIAAADRLAALMPGAGHIVHMPSHVYLRVGRYGDAIDVNVRAVAADRAYFARRAPSPIYRMGYYPHNIDFIWHAAGMEGRSAETIRAARDLAAAVPIEALSEMPDMEGFHAAPLFALVRFGRWSETLGQPAPPAGTKYLTGAWRYTRGLAFAATGRREEARHELAELRSLVESLPTARTVAQFFTMRDMLVLAADVLAGEMAARAGQTDVAVRHLTQAVAAQDRHWFTEPPPWYFPVRHSLGAALLEAGRAAAAEAVYREDLRRNPENGWALFGLAASLRAQGKTAEAEAADRRFQRAWSRADVTLPASRF
jgi:tetratricopeptide (TPR) repeat protein